MQLLIEAIQRRFMFAFGMSVSESDVLFALGYEYWKTEKEDLPPDTVYSMIEAFSVVFRGKREEVKRMQGQQNGQTMYPLLSN